MRWDPIQGVFTKTSKVLREICPSLQWLFWTFFLNQFIVGGLWSVSRRQSQSIKNSIIFLLSPPKYLLVKYTNTTFWLKMSFSLYLFGEMENNLSSFVTTKDRALMVDQWDCGILTWFTISMLNNLGTSRKVSEGMFGHWKLTVSQ